MSLRRIIPYDRVAEGSVHGVRRELGMPTDHEPQGIDRRQMLKRVAAAGAVAWTVPAIQTLNMSKALAQVGSPGDVCYTVKLENTCESPSANSNLAQSFGCLYAFDPDVIVTDTTAGCSLVSVVKNTNGTWQVTLPAGCYFVAGFSKAGRTCVPAQTVGGDQAANGDTGTIVFPPGTQNAISHIELTFCCNP